MKKILIVLMFCFVFVSSFSALAANYRALETRAERVPKQYEESLPKLVNYLIKPYENNEEKKAYVLMAWIVYHIDYDDYKSDVITQSASWRRKNIPRVNTGDVFETRAGVCQDIAALYQRMLGLAGIDSVVVTGYAGYGVTRRTMNDNRHAWNAAKINGTWALIDPTWAMQGATKVFQNVNTRSQHAREMKQRERNTTKTNKARKNRNVDDSWFMTDPKEMIKTHFPDDPKWQLLPVEKRIGSFLK